MMRFDICGNPEHPLVHIVYQRDQPHYDYLDVSGGNVEKHTVLGDGMCLVTSVLSAVAGML